MSEKPLKETEEPTIEPQEIDAPPVEPAVTKKPSSKMKRFFVGYWHKKLWTLPLTILVVLGVLLVVPTTRYMLVGWFWQESITVTVRDSQNNSLVTQATVTVDGKSAVTDKEGKAKIAAVHVGNRHVTVDKKYYSSLGADFEVPVFAGNKNYDLTLKATGRLTKVKVTNKISGAVVADVLLDAGNGNQAKTDKDGFATLVVPTDKKEISVAVRTDGYNDATLTVQPDKEGAVAIVPSGKMFFLSKQSGKIDVVKTNYDGSGREVILAGTGSEDDYDTSLLASRDWKYLALKSKRESGKVPAIYLINTSTGGTSVLDKADDVSFELAGWSDHTFIYSVDRTKMPSWDPKKNALKSVNADSQKMTLLDESTAVGNQANYAHETIGSAYITGDSISYVKTWFVGNFYNRAALLNDKQSVIMTIRPDGSNKKVVKSLPAVNVTYFNVKQYAPQEVYYGVLKQDNTTDYYELENGSVKQVSDGEAAFNKPYPTYLLSPNGQEVFWAESRDGKNALFIGGKNAENEQKLTLQSGFTPYGWMTDQYLLLQKDGSELYITTKDQIKNGADPVKISDYHKPRTNYNGYGSGYGGQ